MDRREYTRIVTKVVSTLRLPNGDVYEGVIKDLSFGGAYLDCEAPIKLGPDDLPQDQESVLELSLPDDDYTVLVPMRCRVVGVMSRRVGLCWTGADPEAYRAFREFMLKNAVDPEDLREEIIRYHKQGFLRETGRVSLTKRIMQIFKG